jgi:hypothetical protein
MKCASPGNYHLVPFRLFFVAFVAAERVQLPAKRAGRMNFRGLSV